MSSTNDSTRIPSVCATYGCNRPSWYSGPLVAVDTETTGVDVETARLVSAAAIYDEPGQVPFTLDWLINPAGQYEIPLEATAVHGISTEHAETYGRDAMEVIAELLDVLRDAAKIGLPIVIMNAPYDLSILDREYRRYGGPGLAAYLDGEFPAIIDPLCLDRCLDKYRSGRRTLTATAAAYGVRISGAHTASGDVLASLKLARAILAKYPRLQRLSLDQLQTFQARAYAAWAANFREFRRGDDPTFTCSDAWPMIPFAGGGDRG